MSNLSERRYQVIKKWGKKLLDRLSRTFAEESLIGAEPVFDPSIFPWISEFETRWQEIRQELEGVLDTSDRLPSFHEISPDQKRISKGENWKIFPFYVFGVPHEGNCLKCPVTAELLSEVPELENAMFSILAPGYRIPPHKGPTNGLIRIHLGLVVPKDADRCRIRVGDREFGWEEGRCVVFDDYYEHEVWNDTDETRVVLFFDVDRPMDSKGRVLNKIMMAIMRHSSYVKAPLKNLQNMG